ELERSASPESLVKPLAAAVATEQTDQINQLPTRPGSSAEYIVSRIKHHKLASALLLLVTAAGLGYFFYNGLSGKAAMDSLAVLPFTNTSTDPDAEYLSDGISESLINSLSQLPNLRVMSRNSVFRYKAKEADAQAIGRELNVQAVLAGRVVQRGDNLSISV